MPKQQLVTAFISLLLLLLVVTEVKVSEMALATAGEAPERFKFCRVRRTDLEGQRLFTSCWDHKFPLRFQFPAQLRDKPWLFRKQLKLPGQTGAKAEAGPKNISLPQKCPHVLTLPKECLLVCVSTYLLRAE